MVTGWSAECSVLEAGAPVLNFWPECGYVGSVGRVLEPRLFYPASQQRTLTLHKVSATLQPAVIKDPVSELRSFQDFRACSAFLRERTWIQAVSSRLRVDVGPLSEKLLVAALCSFILLPILIISTN